MITNIELIEPEAPNKPANSKTTPSKPATPLEQLFTAQLLKQQLTSKSVTSAGQQLKQLQQKIAVLQCKLTLQKLL